MADRELSRIDALREEAYRAGLDAKSARIARQGAELATQRRDHGMRVHFRFWEGSCLSQSGDTEGATTALMEAARPEPEADPADIYNAITSLISIAIKGKTAALCRRLLIQGREHLERSGKTVWRHKLNLLEGELALARGDCVAALEHYRHGWEAVMTNDTYPSYTTAWHLINLAQATFTLGDAEALDHWRRALDDCKKPLEGCHLLADQARLLCHRASLPGLGEPVAAARALLRRLEGFEGMGAPIACDALRVLALHRHWPLVEDWLPRPGIGDHWLLGGDLQLARAREALALPARDEDWCTYFEHPDSQSLSERQCTHARSHLAAARALYESKLDWAAKEDQRLETDWYTRTLQARLQRVAGLGPP